jgi:pyridoxine 4-dehydrogenase
MNEIEPAGRFVLGSRTVHRMGYGAMRLAGPRMFGAPQDRNLAMGVLRGAIASGVNHIDTSDYYGPHIVNQLIREALAPYPSDLVIVTKVGAARGDDGSIRSAATPPELTRAVQDNLRNLHVDVLEVVNFRFHEGSIEEPFTALAELQRQGLIRHLGISNVTASQVDEARRIADVVCVQNLYNISRRTDDGLIDRLAADRVAYVPFFPLGGFSPVQSSVLSQVAAELGATPMQVALAWLLQRAPNILLIPGTSSVDHLRENLGAAALKLPEHSRQNLDAIAWGA